MKLSVIPNSITLLNLFVGIIAVILLIENSLDVSDIFILTLICIFLQLASHFLDKTDQALLQALQLFLLQLLFPFKISQVVKAF